MLYKLFTDGGSRGNPGKSACAFAIYDKEDKLIFCEAKYLGIGTNNNAEYIALFEGLKYIYENLSDTNILEIFMDSELIVKQISGIYKIKDSNLKNIYMKLKVYLQKIDYKISHIPRSKNSYTDKLVNDCLDKY